MKRQYQGQVASLQLKKTLISDEPFSLLFDGEKYTVLGFYLTSLGYDVLNIRSPIWLNKPIPKIVGQHLAYTKEYWKIQDLEDMRLFMSEDEFWKQISIAFENIGVILDVS